MMAVSLGGGSSKYASPQLNVTPLVDVALVVLIIFMVVSPMLTRTFRVDVPSQDASEAAPSPDIPLLLKVDADGTLKLRDTTVAMSDLGAHVTQALAAQTKPVLHVDAADAVPYGDVVTILDTCRAAGAKSIAIVTKPTGSTKAE
jgi:biopolymer transport protein ExbD